MKYDVLKRLTALAAAIVLVVSMVACGDPAGEEDITTDAAVTTVADADTTDAAEGGDTKAEGSETVDVADTDAEDESDAQSGSQEGDETAEDGETRTEGGDEGSEDETTGLNIKDLIGENGDVNLPYIPVPSN